MFADKLKGLSAPQRPTTARSRAGAVQQRADQQSLAHVLTSPAPLIQAKLQVGAVNDPQEAEADRVADQVLRMPAAAVSVGTGPMQVSRKCAACDHEEPTLQRESTAPDAPSGAAPAAVHDVLRSPGSPLDTATRGFFEPRFGQDLSNVRVHTDAKAAQSAQAIQARAYTAGSNIVFGAGQYEPGTASGQRLLAHELTHTLQQRGSAPSVQREPLITPRRPRWEARALAAELLDGFALNSSVLTKDHQQRLRILAHTLRELLGEYPSGSIVITGHTDATGGEELNQKLGLERAEAVAKFLLEHGVPAAALVSLSSGETTLRIKTQSQEPRNRRAEVRFDPSGPKWPREAAGSGGDEPPPDIDPGQVCKRRPELCEVPERTGADLPKRCPATGNCSAVSTLSFGRQPPEFQQLLNNSFANAEHWFATLDHDRRFALVAIYNRFCEQGLACHIRSIEGIDPGEPLLSLAGVKVKVPGLTVSVRFTTDGNLGFLDAVNGGGLACRDAGIGGMLHAGQTSLRERSLGDSLHTSIGARDRSDAHLDQYASPRANGTGLDCTYDVQGTAAHLGREIVPEKFRAGLKAVVKGVLHFFYLDRLPVVPYLADYATDVVGSGLQILPDFQISPHVTQPEGARQDAVPPPLFGWKWSGPVATKGPPLVPPELKQPPKPDVSRLSDPTLESIRAVLEARVNREALVPPQLRSRLSKARELAERAGPDEEAKLSAARAALEQQVDYPDADDFGVDLALAMAKARLKGDGWVMLYMEHYGRYGGLDGTERKAILAQIESMALLLRDHLPERANGVNTIVVIFGSGNLAVRGEIKLPP